MGEKGKLSERMGCIATGPAGVNGWIVGLPCNSSTYDKVVLCAVNRIADRGAALGKI